MDVDTLTYRILADAAHAAWAKLHAERVAARRAANVPWDHGKEVVEVTHAA